MGVPVTECVSSLRDEVCRRDNELVDAVRDSDDG